MFLVVDVVASVAQDPVDGGHGGDGGRVTDPPGQQLLSDLPGEHARVVRLDPDDSLHHAGCGHLLKHQTRSDLTVYSSAQERVHCKNNSLFQWIKGGGQIVLIIVQFRSNILGGVW